MNRPPQTLHEHYKANPLGCTSYPEFCRLVGNIDPKTMMPKIVELLDAPGVLEVFNHVPDDDFGRLVLASHGVLKRVSVGACIKIAVEHYQQHPRRVRLPGGQIIKEWTGNVSEEMA
jgi:hypothetical protein